MKISLDEMIYWSVLVFFMLFIILSAHKSFSLDLDQEYRDTHSALKQVQIDEVILTQKMKLIDNMKTQKQLIKDLTIHYKDQEESLFFLMEKELE